jgi:hypothetical protein
MSFPTRNEFDRNTVVADAERALRLIATLPPPVGIEERVKAGLRTPPRQKNLVRWPSATGPRGWMHSSAMRAAAAAAIVAVVAGGGWEVYSHIRVAPQPAAIAVPQPIDGRSGLSSAGAMRTPQTLDGPKAPPASHAKHRTISGDGAASQPAKGKKIAREKPGLPAQVQ